MKVTKFLLSGVIALLFLSNISALSMPQIPSSPWGSGEDSIRCRTNVSLLSSSAKAKAYDEAYEPFMAAYKECPASTRNIYVYGVQILTYKFNNETDAAKKKEYFDLLMELYDKRIEYQFAKDNKGTILGNKAASYVNMMGKDVDQEVVYKWLGEAIEYSKENLSDAMSFSYYMYASLVMYLRDDTKKDRYLQDYFNVMGYLEKAIEKSIAEGNTKSSQRQEAVKAEVMRRFVTSKAANCETLAEYYTPRFEEGKDNKDFLLEVITTLNQVGCNSEDLYFLAAENLHRLEPSANSAVGLAHRSLNLKDNKSAIEYLRQAVELAEDDEKAASYLLTLAQIYSSSSDYSRAKQACLESLAKDPKSGRPYVVIAQMYAVSAPKIFPQKEKTGLVFCAAVDKLQRARSVEPALANEVNQLIAQYRKHFMDKDIAFMMGIKEGDSIEIPGWIGEKTEARFK